jgi:hypothetical protein
VPEVVAHMGVGLISALERLLSRHLRAYFDILGQKNATPEIIETSRVIDAQLQFGSKSFRVYLL